MILKSRARVPTELEPYKKDGGTYSFPICGDIIRRLKNAIPDLSIDEDLMVEFRAIAKRQRESLILAQSNDSDVPYPNLYPYQRVGVAWLNSVGKGILADEQGLGKTVTAVNAARMANPKKGLIICPNSKKDDWSRHVKVWIPGAKVEILEGTADERGSILKNWEEGYLVCNYTIASIYYKDMKSVNLIIVDEAHKMRNRKTDIFNAVKRLSKNAKNLVLVTASPTVNVAGDLWTLLYLCDPKRFSSYWGFMYRFCEISNNGFGIEVGGIREGERENLQRMISPYIIKRDGMLSLPDMKYRTVNHELKGVHKELYDSLDMTDIATYNGKTIQALTDLSKITRLRQLALHPGLVFEGYTGESKLDSLVGIIEERPGKVVIFTHYAELVKLAVDHLNKDGIESVGYTGSMNDATRTESLNRFRKGSARAIVLTHGVGGEGLDLVEADRVIMLELAWHPAGNEHAVRRILRHGQKSSNVETIILNVAGSVEDDIISIVMEKREVTIQEILKRRSNK